MNKPTKKEKLEDIEFVMKNLMYLRYYNVFKDINIDLFFGVDEISVCSYEEINKKARISKEQIKDFYTYLEKKGYEKDEIFSMITLAEEKLIENNNLQTSEENYIPYLSKEKVNLIRYFAAYRLIKTGRKGWKVTNIINHLDNKKGDRDATEYSKGILVDFVKRRNNYRERVTTSRKMYSDGVEANKALETAIKQLNTKQRS